MVGIINSQATIGHSIKEKANINNSVVITTVGIIEVDLQTPITTAETIRVDHRMIIAGIIINSHATQTLPTKGTMAIDLTHIGTIIETTGIVKVAVVIRNLASIRWALDKVVLTSKIVEVVSTEVAIIVAVVETIEVVCETILTMEEARDQVVVVEICSDMT